ncbi:unnamed protein product [Lactuca virosa]|nr:unnamed protein product [Lactuca virosa]
MVQPTSPSPTPDYNNPPKDPTDPLAETMPMIAPSSMSSTGGEESGARGKGFCSLTGHVEELGYKSKWVFGFLPDRRTEWTKMNGSRGRTKVVTGGSGGGLLECSQKSIGVFGFCLTEIDWGTVIFTKNCLMNLRTMEIKKNLLHTTFICFCKSNSPSVFTIRFKKKKKLALITERRHEVSIIDNTSIRYSHGKVPVSKICSMKRIRQVDLKFPSKPLVSAAAKDLISQMLVKDTGVQGNKESALLQQKKKKQI